MMGSGMVSGLHKLTGSKTLANLRNSYSRLLAKHLHSPVMAHSLCQASYIALTHTPRLQLMEFGLAPLEPYVLACLPLPAPPPIPQSLPLVLRDRAAHGRSRSHVGSYSRITSSQGRSTWENSYVAGLDDAGCIISDHTANYGTLLTCRASP